MRADAIVVRRILKDLAGKTDASAVDGNGSVEALLDLDAGAGQAATGLRWNVEQVSLEFDRVIPSDDASVLEAEELLHKAVGRPGYPSGVGVERWDCDAPPKGPWSVVIRAMGGHFGVKGAVVTFPVDLVGAGVPSTRPQGGVWNPGARRLVWPLGDSHAQIVGDLGQTTLENLAMRITVEDGRPHFSVLDGFAVAATISYGSPVVHEMRYGARDLAQESTLGDGLVFTGVTWAASFESLAFESHAKPAGLVRGKPAIYSGALGGSGTLAWESAPGEVTYIGYSSTASETTAIVGLRTLADKGRLLTPVQWETKDRFPVAAQSG